MKVRIKDRNGLEKEELVESIETSSPYLCIHRGHFVKPDFSNFSEAWTVTHISSGAAVVQTLPSMVIARMVADWISDKHDWSLPFDRVKREVPPELRKALEAIRFHAEAYVNCVAEILEIVEAIPA